MVTARQLCCMGAGCCTGAGDAPVVMWVLRQVGAGGVCAGQLGRWVLDAACRLASGVAPVRWGHLAIRSHMVTVPAGLMRSLLAAAAAPALPEPAPDSRRARRSLLPPRRLLHPAPVLVCHLGRDQELV